MEGKRFFICS